MKQKGEGQAPAEPTAASPSFEAMMERLEKLVSQLEQGNLSLEDSIRVFEEGIRLVKKCTAVLGQAEKRIQRLTQEGAGAQETEPMGDPEETGGDRDDDLPF
jgi:exodeoxyribonuclease VII small subunit